MTCGVIYVAWGEQHLIEATKSAYTVKQHNNLPICLITNTPDFKNQVFDIVQVEDLKDTHHTKSLMFQCSPFDNTLFLDTDTNVVTNIECVFNKLMHADIGLCIAPYYQLWEYHKNLRSYFTELDDDTPMYNSGVIVFKKTLASEDLFQYWNALCVEYARNTKSDQSLLSVAIAKKTNPYILPPNYNFRGFWQLLRGSVKIWHSRYPLPKNLEDYENFTSSYMYNAKKNTIEEINHQELKFKQHI